jgi:hypothetical protein
VLLCRYQDNQTEPYPVSRFEELFTASGVGKYNMVEFFRDCSHGRADLSGSKVFGWLDLPMKRSDYTGDGTNPAGRDALVAAAIDAGEKHSGFRRADFFNVVVVPNQPTDLFGGFGGVVADDGRYPGNGMSGLSPSLLGQEMGHGYGLEHSRIDGSADDYKDQWDVMSTRSALMAPHPFFTERDLRGNPIFLIGPGLNAANMDAVGWLDHSRVYGLDPYAMAGSVTLRPLHRLDLPGWLCARVGGYYFEFRMNEGWDAGLHRPVVLVHDYVDGHSYLNAPLQAAWHFGRGYQADPPEIIHGGGFTVTVTDIDPGQRTATLQIVIRHSDIPPPAGPGWLLGGALRGVGIFINGRFVPVPPRSPLVAVLEAVDQVQIGQTLRNGQARAAVVREAYQAIADLGLAQVAQVGAYHEPGPAAGVVHD